MSERYDLDPGVVDRALSVRFHPGGRTPPHHVREAVRAIASSREATLVAARRALAELREAPDVSFAQTVLSVWGPVAEALGETALSRDLEDESFAVVDPAGYAATAGFIARTRESRERIVEVARDALAGELARCGLHASLSGRAKHLYSVHRKLSGRPASSWKIHDSFGLRLVVEDEGACYRALGVVHLAFPPLFDRFKDYIARPKESGYRALHTVVRIGPDADPVEVQIRSRAMHESAEHGSAAHAVYKHGRRLDAAATERWVYPLTPDGEVRRLPRGATPVDFAYAVHTELGRSYAGALVEGRLVPSSYPLGSGDVVRVLRSRDAQPSKAQLARVLTARARNRIRAVLVERRAS